MHTQSVFFFFSSEFENFIYKYIVFVSLLSCLYPPLLFMTSFSVLTAEFSCTWMCTHADSLFGLVSLYKSVHLGSTS